MDADRPITIFGKPVDAQTRCVHYNTDLDILAFRFKCCDRFYPCRECHDETVNHPAITWSKTDANEKAVLCGACRHIMTIREYLSCGHRCPACGASFNPRCALHHHLYFET